MVNYVLHVNEIGIDNPKAMIRHMYVELRLRLMAVGRAHQVSRR